MPSNAQSKTSGSKNQNRPLSTKNASKPSNTNDVKASASQTDSLKLLSAEIPHKPSGKTPPVPAPADLSGPRASHENTDELSSGVGVGVGVNRKKQKRRQKEAARRAAEQGPMTDSQFAQRLANVADSAYQDIVKGMAAAQGQGQPNGYHYGASDYDNAEQCDPEGEEAIYYGDDAHQQYQDSFEPHTNGHNVHDYIAQDALGGKAKRKKKARANSAMQDTYSVDNPSLSTQKTYQSSPPPPPPPLNQHTSSTVHRHTHNDSKDRIWNTSTAEERERIKDFWLSLGEEDRRSLVKVEKEAVLKKMKEQQKHSCSCTVCGRKRTAIEEELEVLYDAYYEELEVYASSNYDSHGNGMSSYMNAHSMSRMSPKSHPSIHDSRASRGRIQELGDDGEAVDDGDYGEVEDDEGISENELEHQTVHPESSGGPDFFNLEQSLTVQGGILTVADDLLKNDGKKFIEMMEQLAERRMQREEEQFARAGLNHPPIPGHNHNPPADDDGYDDEEDEDEDEEDEEYDEDDEELEEDDELESMTELERMREGRRMFQIFAARMFEQRVLTAYREKVALERQKKLLEELDDESRVDAQREAKKAKEAQKKKDKKRQQKEAKDAEKAKREAEKAAEEAAAKALEEKKAEEVRQRKEEQRKKREAEKKAQEEEKQRREADKQRRLQEAKQQQAEQERRQRDQKEREKKKREETKKKEREEREAKEREAREGKEREAAERREREAKIQADNEAKERIRQDAQLKHKKQSPANVPPVPMPPGLHPPVTTSSHTSPRLQIATPVVPKAPTPVRPRQPSLQETHNISPKPSQPASSTAATSPSAASGPQNGNQGKYVAQPTHQQPPQPSSRYSPTDISPGQPLHPPGFPNMQTIPANNYPANFGPPLSPTTQQAPHNTALYPNPAMIGSGPYRNFATPNGMPYPPGINTTGQMHPGRGGMMGPPPPHISPGGLPGANSSDAMRYGLSRDNLPPKTHSRNTSASFDRSGFDTPNIAAQTQPIARPAPIKRPSSVAPYHQREDIGPRSTDVDDLSNHLGSSALLDDTDAPFESRIDDARRGSVVPGTPRTVGQGFGTNRANPVFSHPIATTRMDNRPGGMQGGNGNTWSAQQSPFGAPPMSGPAPWSNVPGFGRTNNSNGFGSIGGPNRPTGSRAVTIRLLVRTACEKLTARPQTAPNFGWHQADDILREVQAMKPAQEAPVHLLEMLDICDTEGNSQNGGGSFIMRTEDQVGLLVRFDPGHNTSMSGRGAGDIGSPIVGQRPFQQPGGF